MTIAMMLSHVAVVGGMSRAMAESLVLLGLAWSPP